MLPHTIQISSGLRVLGIRLISRLSIVAQEDHVITTPPTGDVYEVTVVGVNSAEVRLGVATPKHVAVDCSEIAGSKRLDPVAAPS